MLDNQKWFAYRDGFRWPYKAADGTTGTYVLKHLHEPQFFAFEARYDKNGKQLTGYDKNGKPLKGIAPEVHYDEDGKLKTDSTVDPDGDILRIVNSDGRIVPYEVDWIDNRPECSEVKEIFDGAVENFKYCL